MVSGDRAVPLKRHRDVGVHVPGCGAGRPIGRAFLSANRPPRERRTLQVEQFGPLLGQIEYGSAPAQRVGGRIGFGVGQHRQHETFGVPEGVAVIAGSGESLAGDRPPLGSHAGLDHVEQAEPHRLLHVRVTVDLDIGAVQNSSKNAR